jgi:hypothetical protein
MSELNIQHVESTWDWQRIFGERLHAIELA